MVLSVLILVRAHTVRANELANLFQDSVVFTEGISTLYVNLPRFNNPVHRHDSLGYDAGWVNDPLNPDHADKRPYYRWDINTRLKPKEIEVLKTNNVTVVTGP